MITKKYLIIPLFCLLAISFTSCEETVEAGKYDNWQVRNEAFIDSLQRVYDAKSDPELYFVTDSRDKSQNIFFKKQPGYSATGNRAPYLTDRVRVSYRGTLMNGDVFDQNFTGTNPSEFDSSSLFLINDVRPGYGLINGWIEILQHMKPGERWMVYIPWKSAYGTVNKTGIPAYSTLVFDMLLTEIL